MLDLVDFIVDVIVELLVELVLDGLRQVLVVVVVRVLDSTAHLVELAGAVRGGHHCHVLLLL